MRQHSTGRCLRGMKLEGRCEVALWLAPLADPDAIRLVHAAREASMSAVGVVPFRRRARGRLDGGSPYRSRELKRGI